MRCPSKRTSNPDGCVPGRNPTAQPNAGSGSRAPFASGPTSRQWESNCCDMSTKEDDDNDAAENLAPPPSSSVT